ncbi:RnfABCDGE type electron transport complex subunit D, partial [Candidatus Omnitrophota bacterium]
MADQLTVTISPHIRSKKTTTGIMWSVVAALLPVGAWGVHAFGMRA